MCYSDRKTLGEWDELCEQQFLVQFTKLNLMRTVSYTLNHCFFLQNLVLTFEISSKTLLKMGRNLRKHNESEWWTTFFVVVMKCFINYNAPQNVQTESNNLLHGFVVKALELLHDLGTSTTLHSDSAQMMPPQH